MQIRLGEFVFYSDDYPGASGFTFAGWSGWTDGPGQRRDAAARPSGHGSFRARSFATDRVVSWQGRYTGTSVEDVAYKGQVLTGLEGLDVRVEVQREETLWADVTVDRVRFAESGYAAWADYQIELWMPDPFKYGGVHTSVSTGANVPTSHRGNTAAHPRFTVTGAMPAGYRIVGKGRSFVVPGPLASGQTDVVDFRAASVRRDGVLVTGVTPRTFSVAGGENVSWQLVPVSGSGSAVMSLVDTFI